MFKKYARDLLLAYYGLVLHLRKSYQYIHLLTHPRSGSTLLSHLLVSNPDIIGIGETKLVYSKISDLKKLPAHVALGLYRFPLLGNEKYVLDKLVHDHLIAADDLADMYKNNSCVIFLLREPSDTLNSMSRLPWVSQKPDREKFVTNSYVTRINTIRRYSQQLERSECKRRAVVTFEQIVYHTDAAFRLLENLLELSHPLSESYELLRTTGRWAYGDSSNNIKSGHIIRNRDSRNAPGRVDFHPDMDMVMQAYHKCYRELTRSCLCL